MSRMLRLSSSRHMLSYRGIGCLFIGTASIFVISFLEDLDRLLPDRRIFYTVLKM